MPPKITVMLVDDHMVVRAGFKLLLSGGDAIEVIAEASCGEEAIQLYSQWQPDIVVMDLSMPGIGGLETIRRIVQRDQDALLLVFSVHHQHVYVSRAISAGAKGYITKNSAPIIINEAIMAIMQGECYIEQGLLKHADQAPPITDYHAIIQQFSPREFDVFKLLSQGQTVENIALQLCLGKKTVANYATQIKKKLHIHTATELAHIAVNLGINLQ